MVAAASAAAFGLESALELQFETHYRRFLMPTIRGAEARQQEALCRARCSCRTAAKRSSTRDSKRYAPTGRHLRSSSSGNCICVSSSSSRIRTTCAITSQRTLSGEFDELLVYRKPLAPQSRRLSAQRAAACACGAHGRRIQPQQGRPLQYQNGGWISYVMTVAGPEPLETQRSAIDYDHYLDAPATAGGGRDPALSARRLRNTDQWSGATFRISYYQPPRGA